MAALVDVKLDKALAVGFAGVGGVTRAPREQEFGSIVLLGGFDLIDDLKKSVVVIEAGIEEVIEDELEAGAIFHGKKQAEPCEEEIVVVAVFGAIDALEESERLFVLALEVVGVCELLEPSGVIGVVFDEGFEDGDQTDGPTAFLVEANQGEDEIGLLVGLEHGQANGEAAFPFVEAAHRFVEREELLEGLLERAIGGVTGAIAVVAVARAEVIGDSAGGRRGSSGRFGDADRTGFFLPEDLFEKAGSGFGLGFLDVEGGEAEADRGFFGFEIQKEFVGLDSVVMEVVPIEELRDLAEDAGSIGVFLEQADQDFLGWSGFRDLEVHLGELDSLFGAGVGSFFEHLAEVDDGLFDIALVACGFG